MAFLLSLLLALTLSTSADGEPKARQGPFALTNARIVTVSGGVIEQGTVVIRGETIEAVGANVQPPADAEVIDCTGLTIYPGFIDAGTQLGLVEVGSLPETRDANEIGEITPQMHALTAVNPNSISIPVTRVNGVTTVLTEPSGGLFPGTAALIDLHGYTPEQMHVGDATGVLLEFPVTGRRGRWDRRTDEEVEKARKKAMEKLEETWEQAVLYHRIDSAYAIAPEPGRRPAYVPEMQALLPAVRGSAPLIIKVNQAKDIEAALDWVKASAIPNVIFSGVAEGWRVAEKIAAAGIPCLIGPVLSVPGRDSDRFDKAYANAGLLKEAGVQIALRTGEVENVRNLPYHAGFSAAYGLGRDDALRAVTLGPARIFGVSDLIGSLEPGKKANLFVADGDPFETNTKIRHLFIKGWQIPLESRQTRLYEEFLQRSPGLEEAETRPGTQ